MLSIILSAALFLSASLAAQAQTSIFGLGTLTQNVAPGGFFFPPGGNAGDQALASFNPTNGAPNAQIRKIAGVTAGQKLVGLDFRASTGQLYALGYNTTSNDVQLYRLDADLTNIQRAVATPVNTTPIPLLLGGATARIGFAIEPNTDSVRVVSSNQSNYRLSVLTGLSPLVLNTTTPRPFGLLTYASPDAALNPERVSGIAYTNSFPGSTSSTLYAVEVRPGTMQQSAFPGVLSTLAPANSGTLNKTADITLQGFPIDAEAVLNLDIYSNGSTDTAYLFELTAPNGSGYSASNLYSFSLTTGAATARRNMVPANFLTPFNLVAIAAAPMAIITSLVPNSAEAGTPGLTLTVNGTGFLSAATVQFNGSDRTTTYGSATQLTATLTAADLATAGTYNVTVTNPPFPGVASAPATFTVTPACAAPTNLTAGSITSTSATVSFTGNGSATSYTVTTTPTTTTQTLPGSATSVNFAGLTPSTNYTVSITTTCPSGTTSPATVAFTTSVAVASLAVTQAGTSYPSSGTAYNFGNQTLSTTSPAVAFTLTNGGTDPLTIGSITTTGDYAVSGTAPTTVPAGGTATVSVTFTPTATGTRSGTLVINSNATNGAVYTVNLTGNGLALPAPTLAVRRGPINYPNGGTAYNFGNQTVNTTSPAVTFNLVNRGIGPLTIGSITTTGNYAVSGATPTTVPAGDSATVSVTFTPTATGTRPGTLVINSNATNGATYTVNLTGNGLALPAPTLAVTQAGTSYPSSGTAYNFGNQTLSTTSPAVAFTLTNGGTGPLTIGSITTTGDYAVSGATPTTVPAGGTATVSVTFTPTATGTRSGTLVINSNATNGAVYTVNLTGSGQALTPNPLIAVSQGGTGIANGGTFTGFASTQQGSTSAPVTFTISNGSPTDALTLGTFSFSGPYALSGAAPTSVASGGTATFSVTFSPTAVGANAGAVSIANNSQTNNPYLVNFSGQGSLPDLVVSTPQAVQGSYRNVTIVGPNGVATLNGTLTVSGTLTVQTGGSLIQNCQTITGTGNFDLQAGGAMAICDPAGIATTGPTGAVQVTGTRSFSPLASYLYNGTVAQVTGPGLPAQVLNLGVLNPANATLSQAVAVVGVVRLQSGSLNTGGQTFTLLSSAVGTALVDNSGGGVVNGTATVQRFINSSNALGYRHYSAPVSNTTLADLSAPGFTPTFNPAYNSSATPGTITPFPTVFGYDQSRLATVTSNFSAFDKGWFSPVATDPMAIARGYTVNAPNTALIDFVGTLNNGNISTGTLSRGPDPDAGWQLVGNPYPSPIDWSTITAGQRPGIDAALYVFESAGQYGGSYRTNVNGVGGNGNISPLIVSGSGCFVRVTTPNGTGRVDLTNANRVTTFGAQPSFGRGTTDLRPQIALTLQGAAVADAAYVYFQAGATAGQDVEFDATKLANPHGLNLSSLANGEALTINGLPALSTAPVLVPLHVAAPQPGRYALTADALTNLAGTSVTLVDALTSTRMVLTAGTIYSFNLSGTNAAGRFALEFRPNGALATTAAQALTAQTQLFPNPASGSFRVQLPMQAAKTTVQATLLNTLGQPVLRRSLSAAAGQALDAEFDVRTLAAGVYTLRLDVAGTFVTRKVVVE